MKWFVILLCAGSFLALLPVNRLPAGVSTSLWTLLGFLALQQGPLGAYFALISWAHWPGYVKGFEVAGLDLLAFGFLLRHWSAKLPIFPILPAMAVYIAIVIGCAMVANEPQAGLFYAWQLGRVFLIGYAVYRGVASDERAGPAIFNGTAIALLVILYGAIWDSVIGGRLQTGGAFGHQNMLGMMTHFVSLPALLVVLAGGSNGFIAMAALSGPLAAWLTVSRATLGIVAIGYAVTLALSLLRRWTGRKMLVVAAGMICVAPLAPATIGSFEIRLARDQAVDQTGIEDEREVFERVAALMLSEHPFGIGPNHYVRAANMDGYAVRGGVIPTEGSRGAHVHNVYWLVAAETGYLGLIAFVVLLLIPLVQAFRVGWRHRNDRLGDLLLGLGMSLLAIYVHSMYEWLLVTFQMQYMLTTTAGLIAGLAYRLRRSETSKQRTPPRKPLSQENIPNVSIYK